MNTGKNLGAEVVAEHHICTSFMWFQRMHNTVFEWYINMQHSYEEMNGKATLVWMQMAKEAQQQWPCFVFKLGGRHTSAVLFFTIFVSEK